MGNTRLNLARRFQSRKHGEQNHNDDWLSGLPDDVLVVILSSLPTRAAARTSVLSSRWKNLWRHSRCLSFDADDALHKIEQDPSLRIVERQKYIDWVNSVLRSHKAPTLDEFKICFDLDKSSSEEITTWLEFAFARRVQRLELSLLSNGGYDGSKCKYRLPAEFLGRKEPSGTPFDIKSLKALCLRGVNVNSKEIEFLLHNCPFLEQLILQGSWKMSKIEVVQGVCKILGVEICGSSLALKHLEIFNCGPYRGPQGLPITISAPNLTSLKVETLSALLLENVPMLVEVNLMNGYTDLYRNKLVHVLDCCISQLETLTMDLTPDELQEVELREFPQMPKLKKLKTEFFGLHGKSLMQLTPFIQASPNLQQLEIKITGTFSWTREREVGGDAVDFTHQHLKVLKLSGCCVGAHEFEFLRYIWTSCVALEKIVLDPRYHPAYQSSHSHRPPAPQNAYGSQTVRSHEKKRRLKPHVPNHIQLLIL